MERYGLRPGETMAFGDGENDIDMIRFAGIGVAMGNAIKNLKSAADYITTDIDDDGIANALKHFGLIDRQHAVHAGSRMFFCCLNCKTKGQISAHTFSFSKQERVLLFFRSLRCGIRQTDRSYICRYHACRHA